MMEAGTFVRVNDVFGNYQFGLISDIVTYNDTKLYKVNGLLYHASQVGNVLTTKQIMQVCFYYDL